MFGKTIEKNDSEETPQKYNNTRGRRRFYGRKKYRKPFFVEAVTTDESSSAQLPEKKTRGSAGFDLKAFEDGEIAPGQILTKVRTGIRIKVPFGTVGMITPRSGLSCKGLTIINSPGIIDSDYRGELMINFFNCGSETISWKAGDRIAQILFVPVKVGNMTLVPEFSPDKFENTRNEDGFGSTGEN